MGNTTTRDMSNGSDLTEERPDGGDCPMPVAREIPPPESPRRSQTPFLLAPQNPVAPLLRPADSSSGINYNWPTDSNGPYMAEPSGKGIPALITWSQGGNIVFVEGSWDNWSTRTPLQKSGKDHTILLVLPSGIYHYKLIVDGASRYITDLPCVTDEEGQVVNLLDVTDYVPESVDSVSAFDAPPSPESSYDRHFPGEEEFTKEAPMLPSQLLDPVLKNSDEPSLGKPQHVVLNHLFLEKGVTQRSMLALSLTHRFESKYVTVVLYKPIKR
ncbi:5'-AMP-activated protein kinase subunit beta [Rhynchospora pubera]|uniref:5'-AMP-activated protein kinase subunit beta n=1 Tax=Rhynchospora pubera TaxID=906938 RepID=A0AAV8HXL4_9POAL|nr:5'-AMP-activated protein kinase subunit beta [Rhynchospora pubera]